MRLHEIKGGVIFKFEYKDLHQETEPDGIPTPRNLNDGPYNLLQRKVSESGSVLDASVYTNIFTSMKISYARPSIAICNKMCEKHTFTVKKGDSRKTFQHSVTK